jgi:hypothetical protein
MQDICCSSFLHVIFMFRVHVFFMFSYPMRGTGDSPMLAPPYAGSSARAAAGRRVLDQLVQLTGRCLMPLIQPERGGPGHRVW